MVLHRRVVWFIQHFTNLKLFKRYIIGSPSLTLDNYSIYNYEQIAPDKIGEKGLKLLLSVGSEESDPKNIFDPIE